jgi:hypothetical protein
MTKIQATAAPESITWTDLQQALGGDAGGQRLDIRHRMRGCAGVAGGLFSRFNGMNRVVPVSAVWLSLVVVIAVLLVVGCWTARLIGDVLLALRGFRIALRAQYWLCRQIR